MQNSYHRSEVRACLGRGGGGDPPFLLRLGGDSYRGRSEETRDTKKVKGGGGELTQEVPMIGGGPTLLVEMQLSLLLVSLQGSGKGKIR